MHIYDQLWNEAMVAFESGRPRLDPYLLNPAADLRRGVSLAFRLSPSLQAGVKKFLDQLAPQLPGQYFYRPEELHVTIVTLISATEHWQREYADIEAFRSIVREVLKRHRRFKVKFHGITAAANAILVQGFALDEILEEIRADLRATFAQRGFPNRLDRRYPNQAAHVTAVRFCQPEADWKRLAATLAARRQDDFGEMEVTALQLTLGDWYASSGATRLIEEYRLPQTRPPACS